MQPTCQVCQAGAQKQNTEFLCLSSLRASDESSASQGLGVSSQGCPYVSRPAVQPVIKLIR